jgi:hypothetical protein
LIEVIKKEGRGSGGNVGVVRGWRWLLVSWRGLSRACGKIPKATEVDEVNIVLGLPYRVKMNCNIRRKEGQLPT